MNTCNLKHHTDHPLPRKGNKNILEFHFSDCGTVKVDGYDGELTGGMLNEDAAKGDGFPNMFALHLILKAVYIISLNKFIKMFSVSLMIICSQDTNTLTLLYINKLNKSIINQIRFCDSNVINIFLIADLRRTQHWVKVKKRQWAGLNGKANFTHIRTY